MEQQVEGVEEFAEEDGEEVAREVAQPVFEGFAEVGEAERCVGEERVQLVDGVLEGSHPEVEGVVFVDDDIDVFELSFDLGECCFDACAVYIELCELEFKLSLLKDVLAIEEAYEGEMGLCALFGGFNELQFGLEGVFLGFQLFGLGGEDGFLGGTHHFARGALSLQEFEGIARVLQFGVGEFYGGLGAEAGDVLFDFEGLLSDLELFGGALALLLGDLFVELVDALGELFLDDSELEDGLLGWQFAACDGLGDVGDVWEHCHALQGG